MEREKSNPVIKWTATDNNCLHVCDLIGTVCSVNNTVWSFATISVHGNGKKFMVSCLGHKPVSFSSIQEAKDFVALLASSQNE